MANLFLKFRKYVNKAISDVINEYLQTSGPVSPLMIDDVRPDLTTRQYFEDMIKRNSNSITGPIPTAIFTMNKEDDSKGVVLIVMKLQDVFGSYLLNHHLKVTVKKEI